MGGRYYWMLIFVILAALGREGLARSSTGRPFRGGAGSLATASPLRRAPTTRVPAYSKTSTASSTATTDRETAKEMLDAFLTRDSRNSFIARVYAILAAQLVVTAASIYLFGSKPNLTNWMHHQAGWGVAVPIVSLLVSMVAWYIMCVSTETRRKSPVKWQLLTLFTVGEAVSVGFISSLYKFQSVVSAMMATAVAATGVSVYSVTQKNAKYDLSQWGATLSSFGLAFMIYGLLTIFQMVGVLPANFLPYSDMVYGLVGATLFSFYLAYHTKLITAGKHAKYQMNEKDYVFGAMTLYNDIINIFIYLLKVIGEDREH